MKRIVLFVLVIMICTLVGCSNTEEPLETTKESAVNEVETSIVEKQEKYDYANDSKILWRYGDYAEYKQYEEKTMLNEYGKVSFDATFMLLGGYFKDELLVGHWKDKYWHVKCDRLRLCAVMVTETSGKTASQLYDDYVKNKEYLNEFTGWSENEIYSELKKREEEILIFVPSNEIGDMISAGCPEDMMVTLSWYSYDNVDDGLKKETKLFYEKGCEFWEDYNIIWGFGQQNYYAATSVLGKVTDDGTFGRLKGTKFVTDKPGRLYAIRVVESSGKTCEEFYNNYIKNIDAPNEFSGLSEGELARKLNERNKMAVIYVFLNQEQVESIISNGCPEDMAIELYWYGLSTEYLDGLISGAR